MNVKGEYKLEIEMNYHEDTENETSWDIISLVNSY